MKYFIVALLVLSVFAQDAPLTATLEKSLDKIVYPCANPDYECLANPGAYFNPKTCRCECNAHCRCKSRLHTWSGYPTCQCTCKKLAKCTELQYFDRSTCECKCKYQIICFNPAYIQDPRTCQCVCKPVVCKYGQYQDSSCRCVPRTKETIKYPKHKDHECRGE